MTYKCLVVDDEELARELIVDHLSKLEEFELVAACASAIEARTILKQQRIDLMFLDIEMPVLKGTDFFKHLLQPPRVIFTTAYRDYAVEGFELNAVDYLLKPITFDRFFKAIDKFLNQQLPSPPATSNVPSTTAKATYIFIRKDRKQVKLFLHEIVYIESLKDYIQIHETNQKHVVKYSLVSFISLLDHRFLRVHRSYVINVDKVTAYTKHDVELGPIEVPIGENYKQTVQEYFQA
ncbi:MAG TPA: DNA-binding response regulator [Microscillaceae bacterium]|nr:DNA-binding response regulator [Microscillaceae bacterium]